jgi:hypothetical protein
VLESVISDSIALRERVLGGGRKHTNQQRLSIAWSRQLRDAFRSSIVFRKRVEQFQLETQTDNCVVRRLESVGRC